MAACFAVKRELLRRVTLAFRALTPAEVLLVCTLGLILTVALVGCSEYSARLNRSALASLRFALKTERAVGEITRVIESATAVEVTEKGTCLLCTDERNVTSAIYYRDGDRKPETLADNEIWFLRNIHAADSKPVVVGRYVTPLRNKPVFRYIGRTRAVEINFWVGDPRRMPKAILSADEGAALPGVDYRGAFGLRKSS